MKANGIRTIVIRGILLILLSLYFLVVFAQKSPNLVSFDAVKKEQAVSLQWLLSPSNNLSTVVIEKKLSNNSFQPIAEFWVNFEGNKECNFRFIDKNIKLRKLQYRLKLVTDKGVIEYSEIVSSSTGLSKEKKSQVTLANQQYRSNNETVSLDLKQTDSNEKLKSILLLQLQEREINYL